MARRFSIFVGLFVCVLLSACFFGRRGRNLDRAIEHKYECAAAEGYRYEKVSSDRYRVRVCYDRSTQRYRHRAVFHCSRKRCASLSGRAAQLYSAGTGCARENVQAHETTDSGVFQVTGCGSQAMLSCEMRDNEVSCSAMQPIPTLPLAPATTTPATTSGGEAPQAPDASAAAAP